MNNSSDISRVTGSNTTWHVDPSSTGAAPAYSSSVSSSERPFDLGDGDLDEKNKYDGTLLYSAAQRIWEELYRTRKTVSLVVIG